MAATAMRQPNLMARSRASICSGFAAKLNTGPAPMGGATRFGGHGSRGFRFARRRLDQQLNARPSDAR